MFSSKEGYKDLISQTSDSSVNGEDEALINDGYSRTRLCYGVPIPTFCLTILATAAITFWFTFSFAKQRTAIVETGSDDLPLDADSPFAQMDRTYHTTIFPAWNWTASPFTQAPNGDKPEDNVVDKMWDELAINANFFSIPVSQGAQYGLDPRQNVILPYKIDGEDHYIAVSEVVHQLHCLDALRRNTWYNDPWYLEHWSHLAKSPLSDVGKDHCIDMLRHRISCTADIGIVPWIWIDAGATGRKYPQFDRPHKCRNPQQIIDYNLKNQLPEAAKKAPFTPPPGAIIQDWRHYYGKEDLEKLLHSGEKPGGVH